MIFNKFPVSDKVWEEIQCNMLRTPFVYFNKDFDNKKKLFLDKDDKQLAKLSQTNSWECPLDRLNPNILMLIFNLYERIKKLESDLNEKLKFLEAAAESAKNEDGKITHLENDMIILKKLCAKEEPKQEKIKPVESYKEPEGEIKLEVYDVAD